MKKRLILCLLMFVLGPSFVIAKSPPNILYIISDDQAWTDYGFMGHPHIKTPNLDKLAAQSVVSSEDMFLPHFADQVWSRWRQVTTPTVTG